MDAKLFIDKLEGICCGNWATWKIQMKHLLKAKGLWGQITEEKAGRKAKNMNIQQPNDLSMLSNDYESDHDTAFTANFGTTDDANIWLVDSGASKHMTNQKGHEKLSPI